MQQFRGQSDRTETSLVKQISSRAPVSLLPSLSDVTQIPRRREPGCVDVCEGGRFHSNSVNRELDETFFFFNLFILFFFE